MDVNGAVCLIACTRTQLRYMGKYYCRLWREKQSPRRSSIFRLHLKDIDSISIWDTFVITAKCHSKLEFVRELQTMLQTCKASYCLERGQIGCILKSSCFKKIGEYLEGYWRGPLDNPDQIFQRHKILSSPTEHVASQHFRKRTFISLQYCNF